MSSGTQYMLQKNPCTRLPLLTFGILIAINRVGVRNIVWPKDVHVKKFRLETDRWGGGGGVGKPHCGEMTMDWQCQIFIAILYVVTRHLSPLTSFSSYKALVVSVLSAGGQVNLLKKKKVQGGLQAISKSFFFLFLIPGGNHAELLYISYASVRVQCVREGSKKVQKD